MGADEEDHSKSDAFKNLFETGVQEELGNGWRISSLPDGQLLIVPPPTYGEPPAAA